MRSVVPVVVACALAVAAPRVARGDLADTLYEDIRDVVEELIQAEVTTGVVATLERRSPGLAFYLRGTLERLSSPYWGSLTRQLQDDVTVAISDFVYWHLTTEGVDGDVARSMRTFFGCMTATGAASCKRLRDAVVDAGRPLLEVECRRAAPLRERRVGCDLGFATRAALEGRGAARRHVMDAIGHVILQEIDDSGLGARLRDVLVTWLEVPRSIPVPLIEALNDPQVAEHLADAAIAKMCRDRAALQGYLDDPGSVPGWICFAVSHASLPQTLQANIVVTEAGGDKTKIATTTLQFFVLDAALEEISEADFGDHTLYQLYAEYAFSKACRGADEARAALWPCGGPRLTAGSTVSIRWLGMMFLGKVDSNGVIRGLPPKALAQWVKRYQRVSQRVAELRKALPPALASHLFLRDTGDAAATKVLRSVARMARMLASLKSRWYLWSEDARTDLSSIDIGELLELARDAGRVAVEGAGEVADNLGFLGQTAKGAALDIGDWLRLVVRADYRTLAMESLRAALDLRLQHANRPHETFFLTLTAYLLDASDGATEQVARSAFKAAAKDLLLAAQTGGLPRADDRGRFELLPRLAVRLWFNEELGAYDSDNRRSVVSADWPTAMFAINDYIGLEASVLDPLAPLAELALRPSGTYFDETLIVLDAVRPRIGVWVGVPQLSRRLSLSLGGGARLVGIDRMDDGTTGAIQATYVRRNSLTLDTSVQIVF